jgi:hypothetical protein
MPAFRTITTGSARPTRRSTSRRLLTGAAAVTLATLALTACEGGTGTKDEGAATGSASASVTATPSAGDATGKAQDGKAGQQAASGTTGQASGQDSSGGKSSGKGSGSGKSTGSGGAQDSSARNSSNSHVLCNGSNTKVSVEAVSRPLNSMLITVRNTGSKRCDLTYYPILRFDEMQWAPVADKATQPQAVVTLDPGESGYAGALLSAADGSGDGGLTGHRLTIAFQGLTPNSGGGASAIPSLPAKGMYYDSSLKVTYWQQDMADALN